MNKRINFLKSFPEIKEKGELYNLYRGFVYCLSNFEAFELLINTEITGLRAEALIRKIQYTSTKGGIKQNSKLFKEARTTIEKLKWPLTQRVAKVLYGISTNISDKDRKNLIMYFLSSKYNSFRYYGYDIIEKNSMEINFKQKLLNAWDEYNDIEALNLMVDILTPKDLFSIYYDAEEVLTESEFDFEILKLRNKYYSRIVKYIPKRLAELQAKDPVSYVFVMRDAEKKIDKNLAFEIYLKNRDYRSLPSCYGELGMWDVLMEIYNHAIGSTKRSVRKVKRDKNGG